jgi:hypothetical protein
MIMVCDNKLCRFHMPIPGNRQEPRVRVWDPVKEDILMVERHLYRRRCDGDTYFLCDVCHNAVSMLVRGK